MDRFEGAPKQVDPRYIMPEAKALVVMAFRILRGFLRGIEEGTDFISFINGLCRNKLGLCSHCSLECM